MCLFRLLLELKALEHSWQRYSCCIFTFSLLTKLANPAFVVTLWHVFQDHHFCSTYSHSIHKFSVVHFDGRCVISHVCQNGLCAEMFSTLSTFPRLLDLLWFFTVHMFGVFAQVGLIFGLIWAFFTFVSPFQPRHCSVVLPHVIVQGLLSNHSFATIFTCIWVRVMCSHLV